MKLPIVIETVVNLSVWSVRVVWVISMRILGVLVWGWMVAQLISLTVRSGILTGG